jgi:cyclophilin family peptidyl-prolyl cis-trans isomerase
LDQAPLVSYNFVKLAREGFFDGKTFHRVVANFVVQGGDPRGDGYGGPGYLIRDAVSPLSHWRGTVGMATAGKDTAGSQLFINFAPNLHLDAAYTIFARVAEGMDVADRLGIGDTVVRATVE